jgi:hypothetical protein
VFGKPSPSRTGLDREVKDEHEENGSDGMRKGRALGSYRAVSLRRRPKRIKRRSRDGLEIGGVEVRIRRGEVWFLDGKRVCWLPKGQVLTRPDTVLSRLQTKGFDVSDKFIDELTIKLKR